MAKQMELRLDGRWLICHNESTPEGQCGYIYPYRWDGDSPFALE